MGFQDLYKKMAEQDGAKTAAAANHQPSGNGSGGGGGGTGEPDNLVKTAMFYEDLGRELATTVFDDLVKQAGQEDHEAKTAAVLDRMAKDPAYAAELLRKHGRAVGAR